MTPLEQLVESLETRGEPPPGWRVQFAPNGDLRELWDVCDQPGLLYRLAIPPEAHAQAGAPALACARIAIDLAQLQGTPWGGFVELIRKHEDFSDNLLDEAEPLLNEESATSSPRMHLAMTTVYRMLLADDYQHTEDAVRAGLGAVEAAAELERDLTDGRSPRILTALRALLTCPTLDAAVERFVASARFEPN
ncbi:MAG TPA: hypothetical protein VGM39_02410 [Kofleriaceae bacterium]|jgi:hypothetical protein